MTKPDSQFKECTIERRDEDIDVVVEYRVHAGRPAKLYALPEDCYPAEPDEIEIVEVWLLADNNNPNAPSFDLTDDEYEVLERHILNNPPEPDYY